MGLDPNADAAEENADTDEDATESYMESLAEAPNPSLEDQRKVWEYGGWPLQRLLEKAPIAEELQRGLLQDFDGVARRTSPYPKNRWEAWRRELVLAIELNPSLMPELVRVLLKLNSRWLDQNPRDEVLAELVLLGRRYHRRQVVDSPGLGPKTVEALSTAPEWTVRARLAKRLADDWGQSGPYWQPIPPKHWKQYGLDVLTQMAASDPSARVRMYAAAQIPLHPLTDILTAPGWSAYERRRDEFDELLAKVPYPEVVEKLAPEWEHPLGDLLKVADLLGGESGGDGAAEAS